MSSRVLSLFDALDGLFCLPSNPGSRFRDEFCESLDEEGVPCVKVKGRSDIQVEIDMFRDQVDIYKILDRLTVSDSSVETVSEILKQYRSDLMSVDPLYADLSSLPENVHQLYRAYRAGSDFFASLPSDVRAKYDFSADKFFSDPKAFSDLLDVSKLSFDSKPDLKPDSVSVLEGGDSE